MTNNETRNPNEARMTNDRNVSARRSSFGHSRGVIDSSFVIRHSSFLILLLVANGCAGAGALGYKIFGAPTQPALYKPARVPTLIVVENYDHPATSARDSEMLQRLLYEQFIKRKIAPVVAPEGLLQVKSQRGETEFQKLSIAALGREVGAKQIVYVDLGQAAVESAVGSDFVRGRASARVRLIDVSSGDTIWPLEVSQGYPVSYETPIPRMKERTDDTLARAQLHQGMALRIGRLFRKWKADEDGLTHEE